MAGLAWEECEPEGGAGYACDRCGGVVVGGEGRLSGFYPASNVEEDLLDFEADPFSEYAVCDDCRYCYGEQAGRAADLWWRYEGWQRERERR